MDETLPDLKRLIGRETAFLSVAAGKTLGYFEKHLSQHAQIVRAMPNTPTAVMRGITVYVLMVMCRNSRQKCVGELLSSVGESLLIDDEGDLWTLLQLYPEVGQHMYSYSYRSNG